MTYRVDKVRKWSAKWIGFGAVQMSWRAPVLPAPYFRRTFHNPTGAVAARVYFCGLGIGELYLNGKRVSEAELDPTPSRYDRHCHYRVHDVELVPGPNTFGVILGNGLYNCHTADFWNFDKAPWRDYPKLIFELEVDGQLALFSDSSWRVTDRGPIRFDGWRNGETYDASHELGDWAVPEYDDSEWQNARVVPGPGGIPVEDISPPVQVVAEIPVESRLYPGVWDVGRNIAGRVRIKVRGEAGTEVTICYSDRLAPDGTFTTMDLASFIRNGDFQTERYLLRGNRQVEEWHSRFTYHGFQYVRIIIDGNAELLEITAQEMRSGFARIGHFASSSPELNQLYSCAVSSYSGNFVGIPTDCPHREKNGWTADALIAAETGLFSFDAVTGYMQWLQSMADVQRPNGQFPGIVPSGGWGYNYGSGPLWDAAFCFIPYYLWLYTGNDEAIRRNFDAMRRHLDYLGTVAENDIIAFGLGDHSHPFPERAVPAEFVLTAVYRAEALMLARFARMLGVPDREFDALAGRIEHALTTAFPDRAEATALALYAYHRFGPPDAAERLHLHMEKLEGKADFGILGAKLIPRVLAEHGYVDTAFRIMTQPEFPGFGNWIARGATTLWEYWDGSYSRNHTMFGDVAAWMMQYPVGIVPNETFPGFSRLTWRPQVPAALDFVRAAYRIPAGEVQLSWEKRDQTVQYEVTTPVPGMLELPDRVIELKRGKNCEIVERGKQGHEK